jgi:hypothetical protein
MSRFLALLAAVACGSLLLVAGAAGRPVHRAHCAVPRGWKVELKDADAVIISRRRGYPSLKYCAFREHAGFRLLVSFQEPADGSTPTSGPPTFIFGLVLAGPYAAYLGGYDGKYGGGDAWIAGRNLLTGERRTTPLDGASPVNDLECGEPPSDYPPTGSFELSPTGIIAWLAFNCGTYGTVTGTLHAFNIRTSTSTTLAIDAYPDIANYSLFVCSAGCRPSHTIVAWLDRGEWHYAPAP